MMTETALSVPDDMDPDRVAEAAREALDRPADSGWFDDRYFTTHGCVWGWADRDSDPLEESNFYAALAALNGAVAHDESGASEARGDDVLDMSAGHWAVGSVRHIFVRVYVDETETAYTPAFLEAVRLADAVREYPVLDESDFSEREWAAFEKSVADTIDWVARRYRDDTLAESVAFAFLVTDEERHREAIYDAGYPEADEERVAEVYAEVRNDHFEWLAWRYLDPAMPGQEPLPGL